MIATEPKLAEELTPDDIMCRSAREILNPIPAVGDDDTVNYQEIYPWETDDLQYLHRERPSADNRLTITDVNYISLKVVTIAEVADKYKEPKAVILRWFREKSRRDGGLLKKRKFTKYNFTPEEKEQFRKELVQSPVPALTLRAWGFITSACAWQVLGVKSVGELRRGEQSGKEILAEKGLALVRGSVLYSKSKGGHVRTGKVFLQLERSDLWAMAKDLRGWLQRNEARIAKCFPPKKSKTPKRLENRWKFAELTYTLVSKGYSYDDVKHKAGTVRYYSACKRAFRASTPWWESIFTDEELAKISVLVQGTK